MAWGIGGIAALAWLHTFWQAIVLRRMIHKLLRQIAWLPSLTEAMARLSERVRVVVGHFLDIRQRRPSYLRVRVHYAKFLKATHRDSLFPNTDRPVPIAGQPPYATHWSNATLALANLEHLDKKFIDELRLTPLPIGGAAPQAESSIESTVQKISTLGQKFWLGLLEEWH